MTMRRRIFLKSIASALALTSLAARKKPKKSLAFDRNLISVLLGPSFDGQSEFSIVHCSKRPLNYLIYEGDQMLQEVPYTTVTSQGSDFKIDKFLALNLPQDRELQIRIVASGRLLDTRTFSSISSKQTNYKIGLASCLRAAQHDPDMWTSLETQKADIILFLGDCVYTDYDLDETLNPKIHWAKFVESRMVLDFFQWKRLVPTIATWDDHDFGGNDSDGNFRYAKSALSNFKNFFAQDLSEKTFISPGPGLSCKFQLGNQLFFMLDGRSFREKSHSKQMFSMFGKDQEEWIFQSIQNFDGLVWMCNGTQWFTHKGYGESFRKQHAINFNSFIEKLNAADKKVVFASGDVHFSEICGTPTYLKNKSVEITSSCMHSSYFIGLPPIANSPNRQVSTWLKNYLICRTSENQQGISLETDCFTKNRKHLFHHKIDFDLAITIQQTDDRNPFFYDSTKNIFSESAI